MILNDMLLELRAIRAGLELYLQLRTGRPCDLLAAAKTPSIGSLREELKRRSPKTPGSLIHRNDDKLEALDFLKLAGDDTPQILQTLRENWGDEAANELETLYKRDVLREK